MLYLFIWVKTIFFLEILLTSYINILLHCVLQEHQVCKSGVPGSNSIEAVKKKCCLFFCFIK